MANIDSNKKSYSDVVRSNTPLPKSTIKQTVKRDKNYTDDQREINNDNIRIVIADLRSRVNNNKVVKLRMKRIRAQQTYQQRARRNEIKQYRRSNAPVNLERMVFH
ncbi:unnamed protein product [Diatraea saccharalis]|uniref:Uncharacterized protein n=1 Tax=Diatraea saccharalis TaxID=40085 RepID=A0A9N9N4H5_9NEOP|nr:unnamed protein product [Diatraea saccharalis]